MVVIISSHREWQILQSLKELDIQQCSFCQRTNLLNLGWPPFRKLFCRSHEKEHVLCPDLCLKAARNILGCELVREFPPRAIVRERVVPNRAYDLANCYLCGKELQAASKKSVIKNRNNPGFWGVRSEWKILCLKCMGKKYYRFMKAGKKKTFNKYLKRGYV